MPKLCRIKKGIEGVTRIITYSRDRRGSDTRDDEGVGRGQQFYHSRHEEAARRTAGTQKNEGLSNNDSSLTILIEYEHQKSWKR